MKTKVSRFVWLIVILVVLFTSCVSVQDRQMTTTERAQARIVGQVRVTFTSFQPFNRRDAARFRDRARQELTSQAQLRYGPDVEVRNIAITGGFSVWHAVYTLVPALAGFLIGTQTIRWSYGVGDETLNSGPEYDIIIPLAVGVGGVMNLFGNFQRITATGDVISLDGTHIVRRDGPQGAVDAAVETLIARMPHDSTIAIIGVEALDAAIASFVTDTLEFRLLGTGNFRMVSRAQLAAIRAEQGLHVSGYVDDASAVSIGHMLGANLVITGNISGIGASQRLALRVLDVQTAMIVAMALEDF